MKVKVKERSLELRQMEREKAREREGRIREEERIQATDSPVFINRNSI